MSNSLPGEMLCYGLLTILCGRIFFIKRERIISISILAPIVLLIALLQIIAWGAGLPEIIILILSILVFIANIHAIIRFALHLYVDHYDPGFYVFSLLLMICTVTAVAGTLYFRPVLIHPEKLGVTVKKEPLTGTFSGGFKIKEGFPEKLTGIVWTLTPKKNLPAQKHILIFVADKRADTAGYLPYLVLLAQSGYTVIPADFYDPSIHWVSSPYDLPALRRMAMLYMSTARPKQFADRSKDFTGYMVREYNALINIATERFGTNSPIFLIGGGMGTSALPLVYTQHQERITGFYAADTTSNGKVAEYGCIGQTDPMLARLFGIKRDPSFQLPRTMVLQTSKAIKTMEVSDDTY